MKKMQRSAGMYVVLVLVLLLAAYAWWSGTAAYNDMYALDTETMTWASVASGRHGPARWNAAASICCLRSSRDG